MKKAYLLITIVIIMFFNGCTNPSIVNIKKNELNQLTKETVIFIPRFEGRPDFVEESTDYYISLLESNINNEIIQGSSLRFESTDIIAGSNIAPLKLALNSAKKVNADVLILGKVTSHKTAASLNGFSTIKIYNVKTGKRIANFHQPSGLLFAHSEHQCVMAAVKETAQDTINMISAI